MKFLISVLSGVLLLPMLAYGFHGAGVPVSEESHHLSVGLMLDLVEIYGSFVLFFVGLLSLVVARKRKSSTSV